jgi:hypothetical protein
MSQSAATTPTPGAGALRRALGDYLRLRRALGYRLARPEKLLGQFLDYLEQVDAEGVTVEHALAWARLPADGSPGWWAHRLSTVRGFATYLRTLDPATEVPPIDLLPARRQRATPYLYSEDDIAALIAAAASLRTAFRQATYQTLIGLLAVTGMRIGEAIALDRGDVDLTAGCSWSGTASSASPGSWSSTPAPPRRCAATCASVTGSIPPRTRRRCSSPPPAPGCSTATSRRPGAGWSPGPGSPAARPPAGREFMT